MSDFSNAVKDYRHLRNRCYPEKAALKLVGDRYALSRTARNCLFRGVVPRSRSEPRAGKMVGPMDLKGRALGLDWYNVLITVESYLRGLPVFLSDDGITRDAAGVHGNLRLRKTTERAYSLLLETLETFSVSRMDLYLDAPVAYSGQMAARLRQGLEIHDNVGVEVLPSADFALKHYPGVVASSDSIILDAVSAAFDLPRVLLKRYFNFSPPVLEDVELPG
jgi:hypothetical protein